MTYIREALKLRDAWKARASAASAGQLPECAVWSADTEEKIRMKAAYVGVLATANEDIRSLRELVTYGMKGVAAYAHHAAELGHETPLFTITL